MSSEKFLTKFFIKLTKADFKADEFLNSFYRFYKKSEATDLFHCYIDYITRNREFQDDNEKTSALKDLYDDIKDNILFKDEESPAELGFVSEKDRTESTERHGVVNADMAKKKNHDESETPLSQPGSVKVNKSKALRVLSDFIKQSNIITYEDPNEISNHQDEVFRDTTQANIIDEIINRDGRELPISQPDIEFGKRSDMMNIWRDTEAKCKKLCEEPTLDLLVSKLFFIDTQQLSSHPDKITTVELKEINDILPKETLINGYSKTKYNTIVKLTNMIPIEEVLTRARKKIKTLYICAGSQMVQGGNADQGINVQESMLYMTSTYSVGISKALHAYPLNISQILLCPNVLVFKDTKYNELPMNQYQRIAVMNCINHWRPKLINPKFTDISTEDPKTYLYDPKTLFASNIAYTNIAKSFSNALETALFFGYDTIVLDDRAVEDNNAPAYLMAKMMKEVINIYNGRFKEIIIAVNKSASFNVFRHYFNI